MCFYVCLIDDNYYYYIFMLIIIIFQLPKLCGKCAQAHDTLADGQMCDANLGVTRYFGDVAAIFIRILAYLQAIFVWISQRHRHDIAEYRGWLLGR